MDRLSADSNSGFLSFNSRKFLWDFVLYSVSTGILAGEKVKYLNHLCRITGIDKTVLLEMEEAAKSITALGKKRLEAKASDEAYSKVVDILGMLDAEEQALQEKVNNLLNAGEIAGAENDEPKKENVIISTINESLASLSEEERNGLGRAIENGQFSVIDYVFQIMALSDRFPKYVSGAFGVPLPEHSAAEDGKPGKVTGDKQAIANAVMAAVHRGEFKLPPPPPKSWKPKEDEKKEQGAEDDESCSGKIYEPWADEDSPLSEKIVGTVINFFDGIADGLSDFAAKL
jgi:hypothetical protein